MHIIIEIGGALSIRMTSGRENKKDRALALRCSPRVLLSLCVIYC